MVLENSGNKIYCVLWPLDRTVLVIGCGPSGLDISCAVAEVANSVTMSYHNLDGIKKFPDHVQVKPDIKRFTETGAEFVDGSENPFDDVIFCTGRCISA